MAGFYRIKSCSSACLPQSCTAYTGSGCLRSDLGSDTRAFCSVTSNVHCTKFCLNVSSFHLKGERSASYKTVQSFNSVWRSRRRVLSMVAMSGTLIKVPNPKTIEDVIEQAQNAVQRALEEGKKRQLLQILLPVDQRQFNFLDTEPRDYPCSITDEFMACSKVCAAILRGLHNEKDEVEVRTKRIGEFENEMDPVAVLYPSDKSIAAVVFPIAETLNQIQTFRQAVCSLHQVAIEASMGSVEITRGVRQHSAIVGSLAAVLCLHQEHLLRTLCGGNCWLFLPSISLL